VPREYVLVTPGDPVWLVEDIRGASVIGKDAEGFLRYGKADLRKGSCVWYDSKYNDETLKPSVKIEP